MKRRQVLHLRFEICISVLCLGLLALSMVAFADWPTHRANPARTGSLDAAAGPAKPAVAWVYRSKEHFIASPVVDGDGLLVSGLGAFNTAHFHRIALQGDRAGQVVWSKSTPFIKRPTVSPPAVTEGLVIFGDGMHQTDDAILYALQSGSGRGLWQLSVPGKLVHLEGGPVVQDGKVFIGGGDAGVLCADLRRLVLDGRELDPKAASAEIDKRWAALEAKYEQDKKADPAFAIPPGEEDVPKAAPKLLWQQGKGVWHVDAPLAVVGDRVLAASAYLDDEKVGRRSLLCLSAGDGKLLWECPLAINPWAGATVAGEVVLVGCSSIRFDSKQVPQARGEVVAVGLGDGKVIWRQAIAGGVLSSVAAADGLAFVASTDGKLRALELAGGKEKWALDAGAPFFAAPAVAGGVVYAADLRAVLHAAAVADGRKLWSLDVAADPAVRAPGAVFGSPVVHGGRVYLATCNLESASPEATSVVACVADASTVAAGKPADQVVVDQARRRVIVPCRVAPRKLPTLKEVYPIEVIATYPAPRGQKAHETVVTVDVSCTEVHKALETLGLKAGKPARGEEGEASGPQVRLLLELPAPNGQSTMLPIERTLVDARTGRPVPELSWRFTGSAMRQPDPGKPDMVYGADLSGTLAAVFPVTDETVFQCNLTMRDGRLLRLETNPDLLGPEGTPLRLIIEPVEPSAKQAARAAAFIPTEPLVTEPVPAERPTLGPVPPRWWLPPVEMAAAAKVLPREGEPVAQPFKAVPESRRAGRKPVPQLSEPALPLPSRPRSTDKAPDLREPPILPFAFGPLIERPSPDGDATRRAAWDRLSLLAPPLRSAPAPLLRLSVPDPLAVVEALKLARPPSDDDPPARGGQMPPAPELGKGK